MKKLTLITIVAPLILLAGVASATTYRKVRGFETDSTRANLASPKTYDLDIFPTQVTTNYNLGDVPSANDATVVATEYGIGFLHQTLFTITAHSVTVTDATTAGAHGAVQLYDFPASLVTVLGVTSDLAITAGAGGIADNASVVCSVGTVTVATDNETLTSTEADYAPSTAATLSGGVGACDTQMTTALLALFDGTATAKDVFLNFAIPDAGVTDGQNDTLAVTGTVTVTWIDNGDN